MSSYDPSGPVYTAPFVATALTTAGDSDLWCLTASSSSRVVIREIRIGQYSEFGDSQAEILPVTLLTGSTAASGGAAITPRNVQSHAGAPTADSSVVGPSTTVASTASAVVRLADSMNVGSGWWYRPDNIERLVLNPAQMLVLRLGTPNDAMTINGTLVFQEVGKVPG